MHAYFLAMIVQLSLYNRAISTNASSKNDSMSERGRYIV